jgi:hypothetical protein
MESATDPESLRACCSKWMILLGETRDRLMLRRSAELKAS